MKQLKNRIYSNMTRDEILKMREFNKTTFQKKHLSKQEIIEYLQMFYDMILRSTYVGKIKDIFSRNVSDTWFEQAEDGLKEVKMDGGIVRNILKKEKESLEDCSEESLALKTCYWGNRIAHSIGADTMKDSCWVNRSAYNSRGDIIKTRHSMHEIYVKYFLNPKYKYGLDDLLDYRENKKDPNFIAWLDEILRKERRMFNNSNSRDRVVNLFLGNYLKNELFTTKAQMLKELFYFHSKAENPNVLLTYVPEVKEDISIKREPVVRLIAREKNAIAPVVMHTDTATFEKMQVAEETNSEVAKFAQKGSIGMHFILSEEELEAFESLANTNGKVKQLSDIMLRGEEGNGER